MYYALIQSILSYGLNGWGGTYKSILEPLEVVQRNIIRICLKRDRYSNRVNLYRDFKVFSIRQLYSKCCLQYTFKNRESFISQDVYATRAVTDQNLQSVKMLKSIGQNHANFLGPKLFNLLDRETKNCEDKNLFKKRITIWLINYGFTKMEEFFG